MSGLKEIKIGTKRPKKFKPENYDLIACDRDEAFVREVREDGLMKYLSNFQSASTSDVELALGIMYAHWSMPKHNPRTVDYVHPSEMRTSESVFKDLKNFYDRACDRLNRAGVILCDQTDFFDGTYFPITGCPTYDFESLTEKGFAKPLAY